MLVSKLTAKYQATIPQEVREVLGVGAGDRIEFLIEGGQIKVTRFNEEEWGYLASVQSTLTEWMDEGDDIYNSL